MTIQAEWFPDVKASLKAEPTSADPFVIHWAERNPVQGVGNGRHGVESRDVIDLYKEALQVTTRFLTEAPFGLKPLTRTCHCFVFDVSLVFGSADPRVVPIGVNGERFFEIALRNRTAIVRPEVERKYMAAASAHEATHVLCYAQTITDRDPRGVYLTREWVWFAESTAVLVEFLLSRPKDGHPLFQEANSWMGYCRRWSDFPELPVDCEENWYASFVFLLHLIRTEGKEIIGAIWKKASSSNTPWEVIEDLTRKSVEDLVTAYSANSYLCNDRDFLPEAYARFGSRAVRESFILGDTAMLDGSVLPLGCHYYRVFPNGAAAITLTRPEEDLRRYRVAAGWATSDHRLNGDGYQYMEHSLLRLEVPRNADHLWVSACGQRGNEPIPVMISARAERDSPS